LIQAELERLEMFNSSSLSLNAGIGRRMRQAVPSNLLDDW
jgi:hypothetical protein